MKELIIIDLFLEVTWMVIISSPYLFINPFFWLVLAFVIFRYRKILEKEKLIFGIDNLERYTLLKRVFRVIIYGFCGGIIASFIFVFLGITLTDIGIGYLLAAAAFLAVFINIRYLCFSYGGGIVALSSLLFGWPKVNVASIIALVGALHLIESILIRLDGADHPLPMISRENDGRITGAFMLQKLWLVPFVAMITGTILEGELSGGTISMPEWWPLIGSMIEAAPGRVLVYSPFPVPAVLGYGDLALSGAPELRVKATSRDLFIYSVLMLMIAVAGSSYQVFLLVGAIFSILGHELVIRKGLRTEQTSPPKYTMPDRGVLVLDVYPGFPADMAGLKSGDIIVKANETSVDNAYQINSISRLADVIEVTLKSGEKLKVNCRIKASLGIVFLDPVSEGKFRVKLQKDGFLKKLIKRIVGSKDND